MRLWSMWLAWLVLCDCGFQSVYSLIEKNKRFMEASWWEWLTGGGWKLGLVLMGRAMLSKSLIQFYLFPSCYLTWGQTILEVWTQWLQQTPFSNNTREDSTHGHHQMVNTKIRTIIFFAIKDGEALYSQQKEDQELTVAQIMNSLLPNSDLNWRK